MKYASFLTTLFISVVIISCSESNKTEKKSTNTKLYSDDFETAKERVEELKKHITVYSYFDDAEFEIFNVNGNFNNDRLNVPGASSWNYHFAIKVDQKDIDKWTSDMILLHDGISKDSMSWVTELNKKLTNKIHNNELGEYYGRQGDSNYAVVFRKSGLVFRRIINN